MGLGWARAALGESRAVGRPAVGVGGECVACFLGGCGGGGFPTVLAVGVPPYFKVMPCPQHAPAPTRVGTTSTNKDFELVTRYFKCRCHAVNECVGFHENEGNGPPVQ